MTPLSPPPSRDRGGPSDPLPGTRVTIPLTDAPGDLAVVRVIAAPRRDMARAGRLGTPLLPFADSLLVDVAVGRTARAPRRLGPAGRPRPRHAPRPGHASVPWISARLR